MVNYNILWKLLIDKGINKTQLRIAAQISTNAMVKLGKNESVQVEVLLKICETLDCNINEIMEFLPKEDEKKNLDGSETKNE